MSYSLFEVSWFFSPKIRDLVRDNWVIQSSSLNLAVIPQYIQSHDPIKSDKSILQSYHDKSVELSKKLSHTLMIIYGITPVAIATFTRIT